MNGAEVRQTDDECRGRKCKRGSSHQEIYHLIHSSSNKPLGKAQGSAEWRIRDRGTSRERRKIRGLVGL